MNKLSENWFMEDMIDFEYKKYLLLGYLQNVQKQFHENKLYPSLGELVQHYNKLMEFQQSKDSIAQSFPKTLKGIDYEDLKLVYEKMPMNEKIMEELSHIVEFAIPQLKHGIHEGRDIYQLVEENIELTEVGVQPLRKDAGYLLIHEPKQQEIKVFEYLLSVFYQAGEKYRGIYLKYIDSIKKTLTVTYENVKIQLIKKYKGMPNPQTFLLLPGMTFPLEETLLPVAKRMLAREIDIKP